MRTQDLNKKLLRGNGRCNGAKKKLAHVPVVSYKFISPVQAHHAGQVCNNDFSHRHNLRIHSNLKQD